MRYLFVCFSAGMLFANGGFASHFLHMADRVQSKKHAKTVTSKTGRINFSGHWEGQCEGDDEGDVLVIAQKDNELSLTSFGETDNYAIGALNGHSVLTKHNIEVGHTDITWNNDHTALIFNTTEIFHFGADYNLVYVQAHMSMEGEALVVHGKWYYSNGLGNEMPETAINCRYHRVNSQ